MVKCTLVLLITTGAQRNIFAIAILELLLTISVILTNSVVLYALVVKLKRFTESSQALLVFLVVSDLLSGLLLMPVAIYHSFLRSENVQSCSTLRYMRCMGFTLTLITVATILFITVEMLWNITKPLDEPRSIRTYALLVLLVWLFIFILVILFVYILPPEIYVLFQAIMSTIGLGIYFFMWIAHYRVNKEVRRMQNIYQDSNNSSRDSSSNIKTIRKTVRMSKSVLMAFGFCYIPYIVLVICNFVVGNSNSFLDVYMEPWCDFIALLNPLFDPIIYCLRLNRVRDVIYRMFVWKNSSRIHDGYGTSQ